ncbi:MAG: hypothetical protein ABIP51_11695 [Bacteroidia bacterium]
MIYKATIWKGDGINHPRTCNANSLKEASEIFSKESGFTNYGSKPEIVNSKPDIVNGNPFTMTDTRSKWNLQ